MSLETAALCTLLEWPRPRVDDLLREMTAVEKESLFEHVRHARLVAVSAVIYRFRVRQARGDRRAIAEALREANTLHARMKVTGEHAPHCTQQHGAGPRVHRDPELHRRGRDAASLLIDED